MDGKRVLEVQAVGVEFREGGGGEHDPVRVSCELERVEGREEGRAGCGCEAVVWRGAEGEEVDLVRWGGADNGTARVRAQRGDEDREESCHYCSLCLSTLCPCFQMKRI